MDRPPQSTRHAPAIPPRRSPRLLIDRVLLLAPARLRLGSVCLLAVALAAGGCDPSKRRRLRPRDAGPAVVLVDRAGDGVALAPEQEPDDDPGDAQLLALPGGVRGTIGPSAPGSGPGGDRDVYVVKVPAAGALRIRLSPVDDADLVLTATDSAGTTLAVSDSGPARTAEGMPNLPVAPGEVRLVVTEFVKKPRGKGAVGATGRQVASTPYELTVAMAPAPADGQEAEPDDTAAFAGTVPVGGAVGGFIGWRGDRDVWKVPLDAVGEDEALAIDVEPVSGVALRVAVLDGTEVVLLERQGTAGQPVALRNVAVREGEPQYFVAVTAKRGNPDEPYTLRVASAPFQLDEEAEPNDVVAQASPLSDVPKAEAGIRVGFLGPGDTDLYRLEPADGPRLLAVSVEPPAKEDVVLIVQDAGGKPVVPPADAGKRGAAERLERVPVAAGAAVFVKLTTASGAIASERYRLRWSTVPDEEIPPLGVE